MYANLEESGIEQDSLEYNLALDFDFVLVRRDDHHLDPKMLGLTYALALSKKDEQESIELYHSVVGNLSALPMSLQL